MSSPPLRTRNRTSPTGGGNTPARRSAWCGRPTRPRRQRWLRFARARKSPSFRRAATPASSAGRCRPAQTAEIVLSLARLNRIRTLDVLNDTITVEAGCILATVQKAAEEAGRLFPLSLAAEGSCQIGGNLSTNAGGVNVLRYGTAREQVLGLEVVLADGRIWNGLRGLRKDNTGYDLKQLFLGAEGTLGIITAAVLRLFPQPSARVTAWVALDTPRAAVELLARLARAARRSAVGASSSFPGHASRQCSASPRKRRTRLRWLTRGMCSPSSQTAARRASCTSAWRPRLPTARSAEPCAMRRSPTASSRRARFGASGSRFRRRSSPT